MDIETLGGKTIEFLFNKGFIKLIPDIYTFNYDRLLEYEGFKEKKVNNIKKAVIKSKEKNFETVLSSLGLKDIGDRAASLLVKKYKDIDRIIEVAKKRDIIDLTEIDGVGEKIANSIIIHFNNPKILHMIKILNDIGLKFKYVNNNEINSEELFLKGTKWVVTGSFKNFKPREKASEIIERFGGEVIGSISSKTTYLLTGEAPGSKLDKAVKLDVKIINENEFIKIIENKKI